jgi:hypothetical protein
MKYTSQNLRKEDLEFFLKDSKDPSWKPILMFILMLASLVTIFALSYGNGSILKIIMSENSQAPRSQKVQKNIIDIVSQISKNNEVDLKISSKM